MKTHDSKLLLSVLALGIVATSGAHAQDRAADEAAIRKQAQAYVDAFNKTDAAALRDCWVEDAEYVAGDGERLQGRDRIVARVIRGRRERREDTLALTVNAIRFVAADVATVTGTAEVRGPGEAPETSKFLAVVVRRGDRWAISTLRDLTSPDDEAGAFPASEYLKPLAWMVGEWRTTRGEPKVEASCQWMPNRNFLVWTYRIVAPDREPMTVAQHIGWDPLRREIRSWSFDSEGGFSQSLWSERNGVWVARAEGFLGSGKTASAIQSWRLVGKDTLLFRSADRRAGGESLPDTELRLSRSAAPP